MHFWAIVNTHSAAPFGLRTAGLTSASQLGTHTISWSDRDLQDTIGAIAEDVVGVPDIVEPKVRLQCRTLSRSQKPITMKPAPATLFSAAGDTYRDT